MALAYALTVYYALGGAWGPRSPELWLSTAALACLIAAGYALNELCDLPFDRPRGRKHPLAGGACSRAAALTVTVVLALAAACAAVAAGRWQFTVALAAVGALLGLYDLLSKRMGVGKQLLAAGLMTSIYPLALATAGWPCGPRAWSLAVFPVWLFLTSVGYELLKDIRDRRDDPHSRGPAGSIRRRPRLNRLIAGWLIAGSSPLLLACGLLGCGWVYLAGAVVAICLAQAAAIAPMGAAIALAYAEVLVVGLAAALDVYAAF
jgi:4-hydroxybenzoate polyprenyltransferase